jgi:glycine/D-amino acid oxidase-like deaminating enzyme
MGETWDVVIAGGGVMGAAAAFWLTRMSPGLRVLVAEPDPTYARASTALSVASIRGQFSNPVNVRMSRFGLAFVRDLSGALGMDVGIPSLGFRENGYLFLAADEAAASAMREVGGMQVAEGAGTRLMTPAEIAARFPWMETGDVLLGSFGARDEGWFDNMGLLHGFRRASRAQGAVWRRDAVAGVEAARGRAVAVRLASGERLACAAVVNAAGPRSGEVAAMAGLALPVEPRKRTVFVLDAPNARHPDAPLVIDASGVYFRPEGAHWIAGTTPEPDGPCAADDFEPDSELFEAVIWPALHARAPGFDAVRVLRLWAGHYEYNRLDQNAVIGPDPRLAGFFHLTGFSGHGLQQAPAAGRGLAEVLLTGGYRSLDLAELGVARILDGRPFLERAVV